mgnify:CR=1 FL=1
MSVMSSAPRPESVGNGVFAVDADYVRPGLAAVHLIQDGDEAAIVDTGVNGSVEPVLAAIDALGIPKSAVKLIILTHIHLDHAGGAGALMAALPQARLVVHPRGFRHMVDPSRLEAGSRAVYGDAAFDQLYGRILPIPADRIIQTHEGHRLTLGGRTLRFLHTPGHAKHHHCIVDPVGGGIFTGDTFGIAYRSLRVDGRPYVFPTTTPVHFDPDAAEHSIRRLVETARQEGIDAAWLTHYSRVYNLSTLADQLIAHVHALRQLALDGPDDLEEAVLQHLLTGARAHGHTADDATLRDIMGFDATLNAQGLRHWRSTLS